MFLALKTLIGFRRILNQLLVSAINANLCLKHYYIWLDLRLQILHMVNQAIRGQQRCKGICLSFMLNLSKYLNSLKPRKNYCHHLLGKPHRRKYRRHLGIARLGGGGLNPCPDGLGQLFWEEFPSFWGGLDPFGLGHFFPR